MSESSESPESDAVDDSGRSFTAGAGREFAIERELEVEASPQDYWDAVTGGNAGWLWPTPPPEPRVGGAVAGGGTVCAWEPPHHLVLRHDGPDGWFNQLEHVIEARDGGTTWVRYVHSGVFVDDWDNQYDGAAAHTDFYLHTLAQYVRDYTGRPAAWVNVEAPAASLAGGFAVLLRAAGLTEVRPGDRATLTVTGLAPLEVTVDYVAPHFLGLHTADAMFRVFGRDAFGAPVAVVAHLFAADADPGAVEGALRTWLGEIFA
ncbi:hypothetical protein Ga0074812_107320 [Parafrankia irregularis]|uniref:Activator of Hsp90 ATPase homolog 1-like protein n=1 Tax=Parafrankia irregularis TaxID=795642 RepID=A0A0S4QM72_9ACTN|nr:MULTISPECIES: ATPase [Parafrankia]CUU56436.1 hypothetical protein Ga0074812_107320 [Parafrankia irregularis]